MATTQNTLITIEASINAPVEKVWNIWNDPRHIVKWNAASEDWQTSYAENDLKPGGQLLSRMEAKDGSSGFDFIGKYTKLEMHRLIEYVMEDGRKVQISFTEEGNQTKVTESFEAESTYPLEMQQSGWQAILNNFKKHVETSDRMVSLHFEVDIQAPVEKVYSTMLNESTYKQWTAEFNPTSHFKGSWEKGAKILFIGTDQEGKQGGMVSRVKENIPNKYVSIEHLGLLQGEKEILTGPEVEQWAGALENYSFMDGNGSTILHVDVDSNYEFENYFRETWPKALHKLKALCEIKG